MTSPVSFEHEISYWKSGIKVIAGIDEVGMGALAGPVVAAAVIFSENIIPLHLIRDSKQLTPEQREQVALWIHGHAHAWATGEASVAEIATLNIRGASHLAMHRAVTALKVAPELLLIDGNPANPHPTIPASNIIRGDQVSASIAAASIIAKVYRDHLMVKLDSEYPAYGFAKHKGYGTAQHLTALRERGATPHHRSAYAPVARLTQNRL